MFPDAKAKKDIQIGPGWSGSVLTTLVSQDHVPHFQVTVISDHDELLSFQWVQKVHSVSAPKLDLSFKGKSTSAKCMGMFVY